jgi:hypothetical protein
VLVFQEHQVLVTEVAAEHQASQRLAALEGTVPFLEAEVAAEVVEEAQMEEQAEQAAVAA